MCSCGIQILSFIQARFFTQKILLAMDVLNYGENSSNGSMSDDEMENEKSRSTSQMTYSKPNKSSRYSAASSYYDPRNSDDVS